MKKSNPRRVLVTGLLLLTVFSGIGYAYLDPGTGSYIVQILIGGLLGGIFAIGLFWRRFWAALRRFFARRKDDDAKPT